MLRVIQEQRSSHTQRRLVSARWHWILLLIFLMVLTPLSSLPHTRMAQASESAPDGVNAGVAALNLFWSTARQDNFSSMSLEGERDALAAGYRFIRTEGYVFATQQPGTVPLKLYYSATRGDNFATASATGERDALAVGYRYIRTEGYVFATQQPGTVPLKLYWSGARNDNFTTATAAGEQAALANGYRFIRTEGYVYPAETAVALKLFWNGDRQDNFAPMSIAGEQAALANNYRFIRTEGRAYARPQPGTVPLKLYYSVEHTDNFLTATAEGERAALAAGYRYIRTEGYVFPTQQPGTIPLKLYYSTTRRDNFTTATAAGEQAALANGYRFIRIEGYIFPAIAPPVAPYLVLDPPSLTVRLQSGQRTTQTIGIANRGTQTLSFDLELGATTTSAWEPMQFPSVKVAPEVSQQALLAADEPIPLIVYLEDQADLSGAADIEDWEERGQFVYDTLRETAQRSQPALLSFLDQQIRLGQVSDYEPFFIVNAILVTSSHQLANSLAERLDVAYIELNQSAMLPDPEINTEAAPQSIAWGVSMIGADRVWNELNRRGQGIVVANIDTGVAANHPAIQRQYRGSVTGSHDYNWFDPSGEFFFAPNDNESSHGTHVMGTMVGDDGAGTRIGVAPAAQWIAARGCTANGCPGNLLLQSAQWILAPYPIGRPNLANPSRRPHIVNNSWGGLGGSPWYQGAVQAWRAAGILPVFAAGNLGRNGIGSINSPGDYANSFAVGATDRVDQIARFSSLGPSSLTRRTKPDVSAPGVAIYSALRNGSYGYGNGTSMASPHVAGCAALMLSVNPRLSLDQLETIIKDTARDLGAPGPDPFFGAGRMDCYAAARRAQAIQNWLSFSPNTGSVTPQGIQQVRATLDATFLGPGTYSARIKVTSNDPARRERLIPVTLIVETSRSNAVELYDDVIGTATPEQTTTLVASNGQLWTHFLAGSATTDLRVNYSEQAQALRPLAAPSYAVHAFRLSAQTPTGNTPTTTQRTFTLIIPYDPEQLRELEIPVSSLVLRFWDSTTQQWKPVTTIIEPNNNRIVAYSDRFGDYALVGERAFYQHRVFLPLLQR